MSLKIVRNTSRKLKSTVMFVASFALALGSVSFAAPQFFSQAAHATSATVCETSCTADTIQAAIDAASAGETITFGGNASIGHQLTINKEITIDGAGKTISPTFAYYDNDNNASIGIIGAANVTINNLIVDGISGTSLHGINVFESTNVNLNSVTLKNNKKYGLVVNNSNVTVNNITTSNNAWGGINVDKGSPTLNITGTSNQSELGAIVVEVSPSGVNFLPGQYTMIASGVYRQTLATPVGLLPANGTTTSDKNFSMSWPAVSGATKYEYRTSNTLSNPTTLGTIAYHDDSLSSNYTLGAVVTRGNSNTPDNNWYWQVRAGDAVDTWSQWSAISEATVDTQTPAVPTSGLPNGTSQSTNDFYFTWSDSSDAGSPVSYEFQSSLSGVQSSGVLTSGVWNSLANGQTLNTPTIHSSGAPDGTWYWQVRAIDAAGNKSAWSNIWNVTLDTQAPVVPTATLKAGGVNVLTNGYTSSNTFTFNLSSVSATHYQLKYWNDISGSSYKVNTPWNPMTLSSIYSDNFTQGEGTHYFAFSACDAVGNCSAYPAPFAVTYDKTAPVATITAPTSKLLRGNVVVSGTVTDVNPDHYYLVVKNSQGNVVAGPGTVNQANVLNWNWDTTKVADGDYIIDLEARDKAGNKDSSSIATMSVTVDNTAPTVSFSKPVVDSPTGSWTPKVDAGDATSYLWTVGASNPAELTFTDTDKEPTFTPSVYGDYSFTLVATDAAGNKSDSAIFSFSYTAPAVVTPIVPTAAPTAAFIAPAPLPQNLAAFATTPAAADDTAVLGASTTKDAPAVAGAQTKKVAAVATNNDGFTASWYWLLAIPAAIGAGWWATAAYRRRDV